MRFSMLGRIGLGAVALVASSACGARLIGETDPFDSSGGTGGDGSGGNTTSSGNPSGSSSTQSGPVGSVGSSGTGGAPVQCASDSACSFLNGPCTTGKCFGGFCEMLPANDFGPCDDGLSCTAGDHCEGGGCFGQPSCPSPDPCLVGTCDASGSCAYFPNDGAQCEDGDACTLFDSCFQGKCFGGELMDCSMLNSQCTQGVCTPNGCSVASINEGLPCNDGLFCTTGEICAGGFCQGGGPTDCSGGSPCVFGSCNEASDTCSITVSPDGTPCDDGSACTTGDTCFGGMCTGAGPQVYLADDFSDNSAGWTLGPEWQIGFATMSAGGVFGHDPPFDHTPTADNGVAGVVIGGNASTNLHPPFFLESPPFNTSAAPSVVLSYWRWLNSDYDPFMHNYVQVFNGAQWVTVWMSGNISIVDTPPEGQGWTFITHDVTALKNANMRVRFGFDITSSGVFTIGSWNLDDVTVATAACP